ncbi:hypothetical protein MRX96_015137 [Rhipicephalus microplus]
MGGREGGRARRCRDGPLLAVACALRQHARSRTVHEYESEAVHLHAASFESQTRPFGAAATGLTAEAARDSRAAHSPLWLFPTQRELDAGDAMCLLGQACFRRDIVSWTAVPSPHSTTTCLRHQLTSSRLAVTQVCSQRRSGFHTKFSSVATASDARP